MNEDTTHIEELICDFVLNTLAEAERGQVIRHIADCPDCRLAVSREREISREIHATLVAVSHMSQKRHLRLMPPPPTNASGFHLTLAWPKQVALISLVLFVLLGSLGLSPLKDRSMPTYPSPTTVATAAMTLNAPTLTYKASSINHQAAATALARYPDPEYEPALSPAPIAPPMPSFGVDTMQKAEP